MSKAMYARWANCTGEARQCAHLTNPEAQAKSHAAQRTPEFAARRSAWSKAAWARKTPEERRASVEKRRETMRRKRLERGDSPTTRVPKSIPKLILKKGSTKPLRPGEIRADAWERSVAHLVVRNRSFRGRPIIGFALEGDEIVRYVTLEQAASACVERGLSKSECSASFVIGQVCNRWRRAALGYVWRYDWESYGRTNCGRDHRVAEWEKSIPCL